MEEEDEKVDPGNCTEQLAHLTKRHRPPELMNDERYGETSDGDVRWLSGGNGRLNKRFPFFVRQCL